MSVRIVFNGTDACPESITIRGVEFPKGKAVSVDDEYTAQKCLNLPFFKEKKNVKNVK